MATTKTTKKKKPQAYLTNKNLLKQILLSREDGKMTDELAKMLMLLVTRYSRKGNFAGYSYVDDMQAFALKELIRSWSAFNPDRSPNPNPFSFFTQCVKNSFRQYLNKEKKQRKVRDILLIRAGLNPSYNYQLEENNREHVDDEENWEQQQDNETKIPPTDNKDTLSY